MSKRRGTVSAVGKGPYSYFLILDDDGFYFNTKYEPKVGQGDEVGIEFEKKGDKRGNVTKIKLIKDNGGPKGVQQKSGEASARGYSADPNRQASIVWQHSQEIACRVVEILIASEAFALKGKADAKRVQLEELLDELTVRYFSDAQDPKASKAFKTNAAFEEDAKSEDKDDEWGSDEDENEDKWDD